MLGMGIFDFLGVFVEPWECWNFPWGGCRNQGVPSFPFPALLSKPNQAWMRELGFFWDQNSRGKVGVEGSVPSLLWCCCSEIPGK